MNVPAYAAATAKLLRRHLREAAPASADRNVGIATIERALRARIRRRRMWWGGAGLAAAAATTLLLVGAPWQGQSEAPSSISIGISSRGGFTVQRADKGKPSERALIAPGQQIDTPPAGGAALSLSTGTALVLGGSSSFRVDSDGPLQRFSLKQGEVSAHVAKLRSGERFVVATPDAEVEVRGTRFRLRVLADGAGCANGSRTRLSVTEGLVEVRSAHGSVRVGAGELWPVGCNAEVPALASAQPRPEQHALRGESPPTAPRSEAKLNATPPSAGASSLGQVNDLFEEAVALRRRGDVNGALRAYRELIARYPASPLAENAMAERMRVLAARGDTRASAEAKRYLSRYPGGFAAGEAKRLVAAP